jgi:aspartate kinase
MRVLKFGGTSVADAAAIERLATIVRRERDNDPRPGMLVVVSALGGVTDALLGLGEQARAGRTSDALDALDALRARHDHVAAALVPGEALAELTSWIGDQFDHLRSAVRTLSALRELHPSSHDGLAAAGELLSSRMVAAALASRGLPAAWADPRLLIVTDNHHTAAVPDMPATFTRVTAALNGLLAEGTVPVTGGFVGATVDGITTTLGRGGSDYSASILGAALGVDEIQIWTDVDGMLTTDPRVYGTPRLVTHLSFGEAAELAYFGAKVLHPKTIQPALAREIPVRILNSRRPEGDGTWITAQPGRDAGPVVALACKRKLTVIDVTSTGMLAVHGFLRRLFEVFERYQTAVDVVTTSEVSVSMTIDNPAQLESIVADLSRFADVVVDHNQALVAIVGDHLQDDPGTFGRVVQAIGRVPLKLVSQAASRRNITLVLAESDLSTAIARLHEEFFPDPVIIGRGTERVAGTRGGRGRH